MKFNSEAYDKCFPRKPVEDSAESAVPFFNSTEDNKEPDVEPKNDDIVEPEDNLQEGDDN